MKIVIATDGSEFSKRAVEMCSAIIGKPEETEIKIVAIYEAAAGLVAAGPYAISAEACQQLADIAEERAEQAAANAAGVIRKRLPALKSLSTMVELDRVSDGIVETAKGWDADLIVVGSHGHGFLGRALLGSVSDAVVHHAPCSVLIVRK